MIVSKNTIDNPVEIKNVMNDFKDFKNVDLLNNLEKGYVIFQFKIAGKKSLEFCILWDGQTNMIADITNKTIIAKLSDFKWGTAKAFSKTLVSSSNWDKLYAYNDGNFKI